jgi:heme exporter protein CcmD
MHTDPWPFINGAYGVSVLFLVAAGWHSFARYRRARRRLAQVERR